LHDQSAKAGAQRAGIDLLRCLFVTSGNADEKDAGVF